MRTNELIVYKDFEDNSLLKDMSFLMDHYNDEFYNREDLRELAHACVNKLLEFGGTHGFSGNLWHCYLTNLLVNNENCYSLATEIRGEIEGSINDAVLHDIVIFKELFDYDFTDLKKILSLDVFSVIEDYKASREESSVYNTRIRERISTLASDFRKDNTPEEMKATLTAFYHDYGVGKFGLHKAFRVGHDRNGEVVITPILKITHVNLDDLVGYESPKAKLVQNTEAFVKGKKANNCLLYGDAGTGKSTCIKAITNHYYESGLRIIELYKHQIGDLNDVIGQIKNRNYKFIIYMDDLSFEEFEIEYKYLKAVIEGGLERRPDNVLIYATSNRRHIVSEKFSDREDAVHTSDILQEKVSLSSRFGCSIYFEAPSKKEYHEIVRTLAEREGIKMAEEELLAEADKWEISHGGRTGRNARQFIDYLLGKE